MSKKKKEGQVENPDLQKRAKKEIYISKKVDSLYKRIRRRRKILVSVLALFTVNLMVYVGLNFSSDGDSIKVAVQSSSKNALSLSINEFQDAVPYLSARAPAEITNITYSSIPLVEVDSTYGSHNGDNYVAYTFGLKNESEEAVNIEEKLVVTSTTKNIEEAIRVMIFENGEPTIYARPQVNSEEAELLSADFPEPTVPFKDRFTIFQKTAENFPAQEVKRFTILIWIEGSDPDCVDSLLGGEFKVSFSFSILDTETN